MREPIGVQLEGRDLNQATTRGAFCPTVSANSLVREEKLGCDENQGESRAILQTAFLAGCETPSPVLKRDGVRRPYVSHARKALG
jgi:hypothetical protein